jgi:spore maturation protein CgeB
MSPVGRSVLIVGRTNPEALERSYARALERLGCRVSFWEPEEALHRVARGGTLGRWFSTFVHVEPWLRKSNLDLIQTALSLRPDLILVIGTGGVRGGTLAQLRVLLPGCPLYCVYPDSPHYLDADRIHCLPFFDRVTTSSPAWVEAFQLLGARNVSHLPFAADSDALSPAVTADAAQSYSHDVTFVGTWREEREEILEQLTDFDLCLWGNKYWKTRTRPGSPLRRRWSGRPVSGQELARVCASSRIMLNIMDPHTWPGPNMRTFEHAACGAFSLETRSPAVLDLFTEGKTIECFDSVEEAREKIQYYLRHDEARQRIARAAHRFVTEEGQTYCDRARTVLDWAADDAARWPLAGRAAG